MSDEDLANTLLGADHRDSFKHHIEQATRNLSVEVHDATQLRRRSRSLKKWSAWLALGVICALILWTDLKPESQSIAENNITSVPSSANTTNEISDELINEFVDDEVVDQLSDLPPQTTHFITSKDVDYLFEGL